MIKAKVRLSLVHSANILGRVSGLMPSRKVGDDQAIEKKDNPSGPDVPDSLVGSFNVKFGCCRNHGIQLGE
jgi:hypothetical protein